MAVKRSGKGGITIEYGLEISSFPRMHHWSLTLHGPAGSSHSIDIEESEFVLGAETGPDVFSVTGEGVAARHAWVSIGGAGLQVEDLAGGPQ